ncbi:Proteasome subunit beta type-5 [Arthrobotrys musiformis]|uniref:Proteasome subunit beta type-5 n=1 Tax=Arthrobotrys musiformis TaxID=47236 RepID=A0AAV9WER2_9PEZI
MALSDYYDIPPTIEVPVPPVKGFDPQTNPIYYFFPDGGNMTFTMTQIDSFRRDQLFTTGIFATQVGAATAAFFVMICITAIEKRKTPIFKANFINILLVIARGILFMHYFMSSLASTYTTFTWDVSGVAVSDINASIASSVLSLLLMVGTQISLLLQVRICWALNPRSKERILATCCSVSGLATASYLALGVYIIQLQGRPPDLRITKWANPLVNALVALSIVVFSATFSWRMYQSVRNRRRMGFVGVGSLESLLVSGVQTLIFPAMFCIIENFVKFGGSASLAQASIAIALPISHVWASTVQANSRPSMAKIEKLANQKPFWDRVAAARDARVQALSKFVSTTISAIQRPFRKIRFRRKKERIQAPKDPVFTSQRHDPEAGETSLGSSKSFKDISGFGKDLEAGHGL